MRSPIPVIRAAWLLGLGTSGWMSLPAADPADELKAAIVLSFLNYAEWSPAPPAGAPLTVGVYGRPAFAQILRRTLEGRTVNGRLVHVTEIGAAGKPCCRVVYLAGSRAQDIRPVMQELQSCRALVMGESNEFLEWGGGVNLWLIDGRMTFEVNLPALQQNGVAISSRLLRFGQIRRPAKPGGAP